MKNRVMAVTFLFSLLIFILSCDDPFEMPQDTAAIDIPQDIPAAETGYGRVVVKIDGASARTVFPMMIFAKYEYFFAKVTEGTTGTPVKQEPVDGYFTLELGDWELTVKAYAKAGDTVPAATGTSATFAVTGGGVAQAAVRLSGNAETGEGKLVYAITYPAGAAISAFSLKNLQNDTVINISASGASPLSGSRDVSARYYFLTIQLTEGGGTGRTTGANEVVYIYDRLDSEYSKTFSANDFSHIHQWGNWVTTIPTCMTAGWDTRTCSHNAGHKDTREGDPIVPDAHDWNTAYTTTIAPTVTENGVGVQTCKHNAAHTRNPRTEYATGTAGLSFATINSNAAYRVSRGSATGAIHIPAYRLYNGNYLPVREISNGTNSVSSNAFGGTSSSPNTTVTDVTFAAESQLVSIANYAFYNCSNLITDITLPASVTSVGNYAFYGCGSLAGIEIPAGVTTIGSSVFYNCDSLASIEIPAGVTSIGSSAFYGCGSLANIAIPANVTSIGESAFYNCNSLASINIPAGVTSIGNSVFYNCGSLTSINIPAGVTSIGSSAFSGCGSLTGIEIPAGVTSIGSNPFGNCANLTGITVDADNSNYASQDGILYNKAKTTLIQVPGGISGSITIPTGVTSIGSSAFSGCASLTGITIPENVTSIGSNAFGGCTNLRNIIIDTDKITNAYSDNWGARFPANNLSVTFKKSPGNYAFYSSSANSTKLTSVTIAEGVTSIGSNAFEGCTGLTSVTIPESVTSIGNSAFSGCAGLTGITIPENVTSIGDNAFSGCTALRNIIIDNDKLTFSSTSNNWRTMFPATDLSITFNKNVGNYAVSGYTGNTLVSVTIGESVTSIGEYAFYNCSYLTSITFVAGNQLTSIGYGAFWRSALTSITIPEGVTAIPGYAFYQCTGLTSVTIPASVTSIGTRAFEDCTVFTSITVDVNNPTYASQGGILYNKAMTSFVLVPRAISGNVTIPASVTSIGNSAFWSCAGLTGITIPESVTSIGSSAFSHCTGLTSVTIPASVTSIGYNAFNECSSLTSVTFAGTIASGSFSSSLAFDGDLRAKFYATDSANGKPGTYTRTSGSTTWTRQP
jgi:hypothetical protein